MYEQTPLSRGQGLDPNPLVQGEFIQHNHSHIVCNSGQRSFPMLKVSLSHLGIPRFIALQIFFYYSDFFVSLGQEIIT